MIEVGVGCDDHRQSLPIQTKFLHVRKNVIFRGSSYAAVNQKNTRPDKQILEQGAAVFEEGTDSINAGVELHEEWKPEWIIGAGSSFVNKFRTQFRVPDRNRSQQRNLPERR